MTDNTTKAFSVVLSNATGGAVLGTFTATTVTILDNDESFVTLHSLTTATDGSVPAAGLVQGNDGNFYGTAYQGGSTGNGTVFSMTPAGVLTILHAFTGTGTEGESPNAGLGGGFH